MIKSIFVLIIFAMSSNVSARSLNPTVPGDLAKPSEVLLGYEILEEGIEIQVNSGGCTNNDSFEVLMLESNPVQLDFKRVQFDFCEAYLPNGVKLLFKWSEIGLAQGQEFFIINEVKDNTDNIKTMPPAMEAIEILLGLEILPTGIQIQVASGGCTSIDSFRVDLLETYPVQVRFVRILPDFCEAHLPYGTKILFTWADLGIKATEKFHVNNEVSPIRGN